MSRYRHQEQLLDAGPFPLLAKPVDCLGGNCLEEWAVGLYRYAATNVTLADTAQGMLLASGNGSSFHRVGGLDPRHYLAIDRGESLELLHSGSPPELGDSRAAALELRQAQCVDLDAVGIEFDPFGCDRVDLAWLLYPVGGADFQASLPQSADGTGIRTEPSAEHLAETETQLSALNAAAPQVSGILIGPGLSAEEILPLAGQHLCPDLDAGVCRVGINVVEETDLKVEAELWLQELTGGSVSQIQMSESSVLVERLGGVSWWLTELHMDASTQTLLDRREADDALDDCCPLVVGALAS